MKRVAPIILFFFVVAVSACAAEPQFPTTYFLDAKQLAAEKQRIATAGAQDPTLRALTEIATKAMRGGPYAVTQKEQLPPSGDKHDFLSMAPYWWPDPKSPNGLPYIRRDGERNPEAVKIADRDLLADMAHAAYTLALASYLTGGQDYAERSALLLRTWFVDPKTRMNPNMEYGQFIRGRDEGRGAGLIESRHFTQVVDAIGLLRSSTAWTDDDQTRMQEWFTKYLDWLQTSKNGKQEAKAPNNHGTWYETQLAAIALFVGKPELAKQVADERGKRRIANQIEADGRQPLELRRTKAMQYSTFNLLALTHLARVSEAAGVNLWDYKTSDGRSIRKALDWLLPYVTGDTKWEFRQIKDYDPTEIVPVLYWAAAKYEHPEYAAIASKLVPNPTSIDAIILRSFAGSSHHVK